MKHGLLLLLFVILSACSLEEVVKTITTPSSTEATASSPKSQGSTSTPFTTSKRIALVIGNAAYPEKPLVNPVNDANDMAEVLKTLGFEVILKTDVNLRTMVDAVHEFEERLSNKSISVFYFSGHGNQHNSNNYLIPLQARIEEENDFPREALRVSEVLEKMEDKNRDGVNLAFLDACRSNLFGGKRFKSGGASKGLTLMGSSGSLIAYATAPNEVADDNPEGRNAVYTKHLLTALREMPRKNITTLLIEVRIRVKEETKGKQVPRNEDSLLVSDFCLALDGCEGTSAIQPSNAKKCAALVIGNNNYPKHLLMASINDAIAMRNVLNKYGFEVTLETDATAQVMRQAILNFVGKLGKKTDVALVYFSGHGINSSFVPIDAVDDVIDRSRIVPIEWILERMSGLNNIMKIIISDARHSLPVEPSIPNLFLGFAEQPSVVVTVKDCGQHGCYTERLLKFIDEANLSIMEVFDKTRIATKEHDKGLEEGIQIPEYSYNGSWSDFRFSRCEPESSSTVTTVPTEKVGDQECRTYSTEVVARDGGIAIQEVKTCKGPDGKWRDVE